MSPEPLNDRVPGWSFFNSAESLKCANCEKEFAENQKKMPMLDMKKKGLRYYCVSCYLWYKEQKKPDPEKAKLK